MQFNFLVSYLYKKKKIIIFWPRINGKEYIFTDYYYYNGQFSLGGHTKHKQRIQSVCCVKYTATYSQPDILEFYQEFFKYTN